MTALPARADGSTSSNKTHYPILDGLRGVAALMVVLFHLCEAYADHEAKTQFVNHGYLAVDFFFLLSGFVIAYAYDDRWGRLTAWGFFKRRLIRLQPMVVLGSLFGALMFPFQDYALYTQWSAGTPAMVLLLMVIGALLIPMPAAFDIRGWDEGFPLNGPAWSLFYEYCANIFYALVLRRASPFWLGVMVALAAAALAHLAVFGEQGDLIGGWSVDLAGFQVGFTRVMFPFLAGVLLMRAGGRIRMRNAFAWCSLLLIVALSVPRLGISDRAWINGLYEAACVILLFPLILAIGAGEKQVDGPSIRIARFLGALSYPLYITHFPLIYIYTGWVADNAVPASRGAWVGGGVFLLALGIAYVSLKLFDEPVRRWLTARLMPSRG